MNFRETVNIRGRGRGRGGTFRNPRNPLPLNDGNPKSHTTGSASKTNWMGGSTSITPRTYQQSKSNTSESASNVILAIVEGRGQATCEVGIAAMSVTEPHLVLCQISDVYSYINTLTKINIYNPCEILIPNTFAGYNNRLIEKIKQHFSDVKIIPYTRKLFNKVSGLNRLQQLCLPSFNSVLFVLQYKYYALAAASALLHYAEHRLNMYYGRETIKVQYEESEGSTAIDILTADKLELVSSTRPIVAHNRYSSLLGILNNTVTSVGARLLRSSILQPSCNQKAIENRLNCVEELVSKPDIRQTIQVLLSKVTNIDQIVSLSTLLRDAPDSGTDRHLNYLLFLNVALSIIDPLKEILQRCTSPFFKELSQLLGNENFSQIKTTLNQYVHNDGHPAKGDNGVIQRCFAIKSGVNGLLDCVRNSYSERLDEMTAHVRELSAKYGFQLVLKNNSKKGYHISMTLSETQKRTFKKSDLPREFIQVHRLCGSYTMKTEHLGTLSVRLEDIIFEIIKMSNSVIHELLLNLSNHLGLFYKLYENIAQLDLIQALAETSGANNYVKPEFGEILEIIDGRHPILEFVYPTAPIANSTFASKHYNMHLITGPNGSGKSIYIRQIVLIQILAQIGCFVPATSATLRIADRILAKIYLEDNMDQGASTFTFEIKEAQYFLSVATERSLIILDELCRSTSAQEGMALAMAICEKLMRTPSYVFATTHFRNLCELESLYCNVKTWHLETNLIQTNQRWTSLEYKHNIVSGLTPLKKYSIYLVMGLWPNSIVEEVEKFVYNQMQYLQVLTSRRVDPKIKFVYDLEVQLLICKAKKQLTRQTLQDILQQTENYRIMYSVTLLFDTDNENSFRMSNATQENLYNDYFNLNNLELSSAGSQDLSVSNRPEIQTRELCDSYNEATQENSLELSFAASEGVSQEFEQDKHFTMSDLQRTYSSNTNTVGSSMYKKLVTEGSSDVVTKSSSTKKKSVSFNLKIQTDSQTRDSSEKPLFIPIQELQKNSVSETSRVIPSGILINSLNYEQENQSFIDDNRSNETQSFYSEPYRVDSATVSNSHLWERKSNVLVSISNHELYSRNFGNVNTSGCVISDISSSGEDISSVRTLGHPGPSNIFHENLQQITNKCTSTAIVGNASFTLDSDGRSSDKKGSSTDERKFVNKFRRIHSTPQDFAFVKPVERMECNFQRSWNEDNMKENRTISKYPKSDTTKFFASTSNDRGAGVGNCSYDFISGSEDQQGSDKFSFNSSDSQQNFAAMEFGNLQRSRNASQTSSLVDISRQYQTFSKYPKSDGTIAKFSFGSNLNRFKEKSSLESKSKYVPTFTSNGRCTLSGSEGNINYSSLQSSDIQQNIESKVQSSSRVSSNEQNYSYPRIISIGSSLSSDQQTSPFLKFPSTNFVDKTCNNTFELTKESANLFSPQNPITLSSERSSEMGRQISNKSFCQRRELTCNNTNLQLKAASVGRSSSVNEEKFLLGLNERQPKISTPIHRMPTENELILDATRRDANDLNRFNNTFQIRYSQSRSDIFSIDSEPQDRSKNNDYKFNYSTGFFNLANDTNKGFHTNEEDKLCSFNFDGLATASKSSSAGNCIISPDLSTSRNMALDKTVSNADGNLRRSMQEIEQTTTPLRVTSNESSVTQILNENDLTREEYDALMEDIKSCDWDEEMDITKAAYPTQPENENIIDSEMSISYSPLCENADTLPNFENQLKKLHELQRKSIDTSKNPSTTTTTTTTTKSLVENYSSDQDTLSSHKSIPKRKRKFIPPTRTQPKKKRKLKLDNRTFVPPKMLSKKAINREFAEQTRKALSNCKTATDCANYVKMIENRPNARQLQEATYVACIKRTEDGCVVMRPQAAKMKKRKFNVPFRSCVVDSDGFDITMLADKNADKLEKYLNKEERGGKKGFVKSKSFTYGCESFVGYREITAIRRAKSISSYHLSCGIRCSKPSEKEEISVEAKKLFVRKRLGLTRITKDINVGNQDSRVNQSIGRNKINIISVVTLKQSGVYNENVEGQLLKNCSKADEIKIGKQQSEEPDSISNSDSKMLHERKEDCKIQTPTAALDSSDDFHVIKKPMQKINEQLNETRKKSKVAETANLIQKQQSDVPENLPASKVLQETSSVKSVVLQEANRTRIFEPYKFQKFEEIHVSSRDSTDDFEAPVFQKPLEICDPQNTFTSPVGSQKSQFEDTFNFSALITSTPQKCAPDGIQNRYFGKFNEGNKNPSWLMVDLNQENKENIAEKEQTVSGLNSTPDGFYKENKTQVLKILDKYLKPKEDDNQKDGAVGLPVFKFEK